MFLPGRAGGRRWRASRPCIEDDEPGDSAGLLGVFLHHLLAGVIRSTSTFRTTKSRSMIAAISGRARKFSSRWHQPHQGGPKVRKTFLSSDEAGERVLEHPWAFFGSTTQLRGTP